MFKYIRHTGVVHISSAAVWLKNVHSKGHGEKKVAKEMAVVVIVFITRTHKSIACCWTINTYYIMLLLTVIMSNSYFLLTPTFIGAWVWCLLFWWNCKCFLWPCFRGYIKRSYQCAVVGILLLRQQNLKPPNFTGKLFCCRQN